MAHRGVCTHCGGKEVYQYPGAFHHTGAVPGLTIWKSDAVELIVCATCGYVSYFVSRKYLDRVREKWRRVH